MNIAQSARGFYRLLFRKDPLLRTCLEQNSSGIIQDLAFPNRLLPNLRVPKNNEEPRVDPRDEIPPASGQPALIVSAAMNDAQALQTQIAAGAAVDMTIPNGETALHYAAAAGATESIRILLEHGADVNARNKHGATPLYIAARHGRREAVATLIERGALIDDQSLNFLDLTPLMVASKYGHPGVVQELLARGADLERRDKKGLDALSHAVLAEHGAIVELLLARMNGEQRTKTLEGALYVASTRNEPGAISALAKAGANLENLYTVSINQTRTALMLAAANGHVEAAQALLDAGADASRPGIVRKLAIATPPDTNGLEPIIARLLAEPELPERSVQILLANALQACHLPLADRIVAAGAQTLVDRKQPSLLAGAVICGEIAVIDYRVQRGYDVDQRLSLSKDTPLMKAARAGDVDLVRYLLAHDADPALVNASGKDARALALEHSQLRIVKMLRAVSLWFARRTGPGANETTGAGTKQALVPALTDCANAIMRAPVVPRRIAWSCYDCSCHATAHRMPSRCVWCAGARRWGWNVFTGRSHELGPRSRS